MHSDLASRRRRSPRRPDKKSDIPARPSLEGERILVVEDDAASRKLLSLLLTEAGARVTAVASAEEALDVLATARPRLIVLDLILCRMGGLTFAEQLKSNEDTCHIVIVAVSALASPEAERIALKAGCVAYVQKPIDTSTFADLVASHLGEAP